MKNIKAILQGNFNDITQNSSQIFEVSLDKDRLWDIYLNSFPEGTNEIYRKRREHDCSCCRQFIKNIGNAVVIKNNEIISIWDVNTNDTTFQPVFDALSKFVKSHYVTNVYVSKFNKIGVDRNYEKLEDGSAKEWNHLYLQFPDKFADKSGRSIGDIKGHYRDTRNVFKRSLEEISTESILTVSELIAQKSLYKGEEWSSILNQFLKFKEEFENIGLENKRENYAWEQSARIGGAIGRIRNHSIGTLLINISEGMDLDTAVKKYEAIVAPSNYKRPKAIYTKKMLDDAKKTVQELGFLNSLGRRFASLEDITVNNILFLNKDSARQLGEDDIFEEMSTEIAVNPKKFSRVKEVSIENFVDNVLPKAEEIEILLENRHANNLVSLIAPDNTDGKNMFKWNNPYSWSYAGNITDSSMKERVKSAGGSIEGVLRFSIQWNDIEKDNNDLDAHCYEPNGNLICFRDKENRSTTGELDVDIIDPNPGEAAVENITWSNQSKMSKGTYRFLVHNYAHCGGRSGFRAEIEFSEQIYKFDYNREIKNGEKVEIAKVSFDGESFSIEENLPSDVSSREIWNLKTNQFNPVSVAMYSPNYWDDQSGVGHRHYFFMVKDCVNSENPSGFYNEFLKEGLMKHKRVFEALGSKMRVKDSDNQLSGLGFSSTKRNNVLVKVKGQTERVVKVIF